MNTLAPSALSLVLGGRTIDNPWDRVRRYCGLPDADGDRETWAYGYYDRTVSDPEAIDPVDVLVASAIHPGITRRHLGFFAEHGAQLNDWLRTVPIDASLDRADPVLLDRLIELTRWSPCVELSLLSKVLHRKRPSLIPLIDRHVMDWYRHRLPPKDAEPSTSVRALMEALAVDLKENAEGLRAMRDAVAQELWSAPSALRTLDIAIWMEGR